MKIKGNETIRSEELQMPDLTNTFALSPIIISKVTIKLLYGASKVH